jgi:hypothetical protein
VKFLQALVVSSLATPPGKKALQRHIGQHAKAVVAMAGAQMNPPGQAAVAAGQSLCSLQSWVQSGCGLPTPDPR